MLLHFFFFCNERSCGRKAPLVFALKSKLWVNVRNISSLSSALRVTIASLRKLFVFCFHQSSVSSQQFLAFGAIYVSVSSLLHLENLPRFYSLLRWLHRTASNDGNGQKSVVVLSFPMTCLFKRITSSTSLAFVLIIIRYLSNY